MSADIMLCYKDGRTAHLIARGDCWLPNDAVIWGTKGRLEVSASRLYSVKKDIANFIC